MEAARVVKAFLAKAAQQHAIASPSTTGECAEAEPNSDVVRPLYSQETTGQIVRMQVIPHLVEQISVSRACTGLQFAVCLPWGNLLTSRLWVRSLMLWP